MPSKTVGNIKTEMEVPKPQMPNRDTIMTNKHNLVPGHEGRQAYDKNEIKKLGK